jgi:hypothetical protein
MQAVPPVLAGFKALLARLVVLTRRQRAALGGALALALVSVSALYPLASGG